MKNPLFWLPAVFFVLFCTSSLAVTPSANRPLEKVALQLKWFHQFQFAGYYAAIEQGYYAEEGLQVEIRERAPSLDYVEQVASGQAEYGIGDSGIVAQFANGKPIVALAAIFQHDALVLFSKQSSGIISPYEMAGKRIMYDVVGENNAQVRALLAEANLNESRYQKIAETFNDADFIADKVDVMSGYITDRPFAFRTAGIQVNIINPQNYGIDFYGDLLFTNRKELQQHPGRAERFRRATLKGWEYALAHPDALIELIQKQYSREFSQEQLHYEAEETRKLILPDNIPLGQIESARLRRVAGIYANLKLARPLNDSELNDFVYGGGKSGDLQLSEAERLWLAEHPEIRVGIDRDFPPYEWLDSAGEYRGMIAEHLQLIERRLGVKFVITKDKSWQEVLDMAKRGELDMLAGASKTPDREQYLNFTQPYISTPTLIIGDETSGYINSLQLLAGRQIAIEQGYFVQELLSRDYPELQLVTAASVKQALNLLAEAKVDAYIGDAASASYAIKQQGFLNLHIAGQPGYVNETRMAALKSQPQLLALLEKALASISQTEHDAIINRWMGLKVEQGIRLEALLRSAAAALLALLFFAYWVFRLRREIKARKASEADLARLYTNMSLGFALHQVIRDESGKIVDYRYLDINPAFEKMTGIARDNWIGKTVKQVLPNTEGAWIASFDDLDASGEPQHFENCVADLGRWYAIDCYKAGPDQFVVLVQDITARKQTELALKESEERFRICQIYGGVGIWEADLLKNRQFWSEIVTTELGFPNKAMHTWSDFLEVVCPEDRPLIIEATRQHLECGAKYDVEYRIQTPTGEKCWMRSVGQVERDSGGKPVRMRGIVHDISKRKAAEEKLRLSARVFSDAHEGIIITDLDAAIIDVNAAFTDITGYSREEALGRNPSFLKSGRQLPEFYDAMWEIINRTGHWQGEVWNRRKNGDLYAELLTVSALRDDAGNIINYLGLFSDITESKQQQQALEVLAHFDPLTQLPNRALFADRFAQAIAHSKRAQSLLAVCYLDLDGFKQVNDNFGHEIGDQLLVEVAKRIKLKLREGDTVCRLGGDEFALLFENLQSVQQCEDALARIHQAMAEPFELENRHVRIAASSGVTIYPLDLDDQDILLRHADQAMYQAKSDGRNRYRIYDHLAGQATPINQRPSRLEQALAEVGQALMTNQFCMYYQPRVNIKVGEVVGMEALIRWQHPERGVLLPAEFLPIVENTSLEIDVSNWVLRQAFKQLQIWHDLGVNLQVSVNISPRHLQWPDFIKTLETLLAEYPQIPSRQLELEVLESSVLEDLISVGETLKQCYHDLGVPCALDDFGTGYSSLAHLRHLTINTVKIDQSFVRNMIDDPDDMAIVESVIALAKAFKREAVAEGVEDIEHGIFLIDLGCSVAQGCAIAAAMPASAVLGWVNSYQNYPAWSDCAKVSLNSWQSQLELLKLQQLYWLRRLEQCLQSTSGANPRWPILNSKKSHLGRWLERIRHERRIDTGLLEQLERAQARQQLLAEKLQRHRMDGGDGGDEDFSKLRKANLQIVQLLEQLESEA
ncbi:EAL domain-containing protein [Methylomonas albis]|uniref:EAL domain-containing protein n=1 Tax=Methylomonas albis TaxID=1854563 RepID=A0ABR9D6W6_9GAMM|nr:EAL domain-containing protein [Methylomonas albis]MBD9358551.1 EAL domain-containing protein [Methylomonas albis]